MKSLLVFLLGTTMVCSAGQHRNFLNVAILTLPPKYMADTPLEDRDKLLLLVSERPNNVQLDYDRGWLNWYSDGGCHIPPDRFPKATSTFCLKLLPRKNQQPLVFVYIPRAFRPTRNPGAVNGFVLELRRGQWHDMTEKFLPKDAHRDDVFLPLRTSSVIQYGRSVKNPNPQSTRAPAFVEKRLLDLVWKNGKFEVRKAESPKFDYRANY